MKANKVFPLLIYVCSTLFAINISAQISLDYFKYDIKEYENHTYDRDKGSTDTVTIIKYDSSETRIINDSNHKETYLANANYKTFLRDDDIIYQPISNSGLKLYYRRNSASEYYSIKGNQTKKIARSLLIMDYTINPVLEVNKTDTKVIQGITGYKFKVSIPRGRVTHIYEGYVNDQIYCPIKLVIGQDIGLNSFVLEATYTVSNYPNKKTTYQLVESTKLNEAERSLKLDPLKQRIAKLEYRK